MLKKSLGIGLLCMMGHAYGADIVVTTTEDIVKDDKECSLREAIEYVNRGLVKKGYMGCGGENSTANILLTDKNTYSLNKHVEIKKSLNIKSVDEDSNVVTDRNRVQGLHNARIKMNGKDNIFRILSGDDFVSATFKELDLEGCAQLNCALEGGLVYNKGKATFEFSKLTQGNASKGGAIYNAGIFGNYVGTVEIRNSLMIENEATEGAVLFSEHPSFSIQQSVIRKNKTIASNSVNIFTKAPFTASTSEDLQAGTARIVSSTLVQNTGSVLNLVDGIIANNLTIVDNQGTGVILQAPFAKAYLANSIILKNRQDCTIGNDKSLIQNNLTSASCGNGIDDAPNQIYKGVQLIATKDGSSQGSCLSLRDNKLSELCPFETAENTFLGYMRPRILLNYGTINGSPIVNTGVPKVSENTLSCESADQRGTNRSFNNEECDRGAIEITVPTSGQLTGQDLKAGETAKFSIAKFLGDSDLIPKEECNSIIGKNPNNEPWQDGCMRIVQTKTPSKGSTQIDIHGNLIYTPDSAWHGADIFEVQVVTSSTRFNVSKPYLPITTQIVQEPDNKMEDKAVKTSGGSLGLFGILGLISLIGLRRLRKD
ncbi:rhombotarget A [Acinetobacter sp. LoGeW2-3]|uniref:rhombotarget A n=1 Tax=Acinetobacter sp. LoGeW2-3 TaxID=1808001 RepID=UPI000C059792|nr:rhombotarget A [Acinetobacter sp. LoGeW2-3]ATO19907.1 rhombotarget A [Acinetobacter sp. LoGeW2-3]